MLISRKWLEQFVDLSDISNEQLADDLILHTVEVEGVEKLGSLLNHVVLGKVDSIEKHPDADKLNVCQVDVGTDSVQVVCGGINVKEGMLVAMGLVGAKVQWHGEGEPVELKKTKIRGVESFGMICASDEIGLGDLFRKEDEREILDLSHVQAELGTSLLSLLELDDVVIDVDNKSMTHRPDLWGHYGLARDVAAIYGKELKAYPTASFDAGTEALSVTVEDAELCSRYMAVAVEGITVGPSPQWMQKQLAVVGINPINNIVDITNYVMTELGQPMHAFDAGVISSKLIQVRRAEKGESIVLLGGNEVELTPEMLLITNGEEPIAIAGVKGGEHSGVTDETTCIVLESANFNAVSVRRTSTAIGLRTDASARFEKSLDPNMVELAMQRAVSLVKELCPGANVASTIADEASFAVDQGPISLSLDFLNRRIGQEIDKKKVMEILVRLGFAVDDKGEVLSVTVPTWRATKDISIPEDLVEEVARMYGYDNIEPVLPEASISAPAVDPLRKLITKVREQLAYACGYTEVYNYSFTSTAWVETMNVPTKNLLELDNPIAKDRPYLRRNLMPNMLMNVEKNLHRFTEVKIFEIGKTYLADVKGENDGGKGTLPKQDTYLGMCYAAKGDETPFFAASEAIRLIADQLGLSVSLEVLEGDAEMIHPGRYAEIQMNGSPVGRIAELHPMSQQTLGIEHRAAMVQMNLNAVLPLLSIKSAYTPLSAYPAVERDVALLVDSAVQDAAIRKEMEKADLVESVTLFDVYGGKGIEDGKKSMAYRLVYRSEKETLTAEAVEKVHEKVIASVCKMFNASQR